MIWLRLAGLGSLTVRWAGVRQRGTESGRAGPPPNVGLARKICLVTLVGVTPTGPDRRMPIVPNLCLGLLSKRMGPDDFLVHRTLAG